MSVVASVHAWGFFDEQGNPRRPDGIAPSTLTPFEHYERLMRHLDHFGADLTRHSTTRSLSGYFVAVEFDTAPRGNAAAMWHTVAPPKDMWPDFDNALDQGDPA